MSNYDDYITGTDKPFAENINDALLLSNVFDLTVPIQAPTMFKNGAWIDTVSRRKCGVAILTLKEQLPSGVSISTVDGKSVLTGTGTVKLGFYPNFNSFGRFKSISWENTGTVQINLKTINNTTILSNISKGLIENSSNELRKLQEIVIEIVLNNSTLKTLDVVMENKQQTRYGADVGISDVTGLDDTIENIQSKNSEQDGRLDIIEGKESQLFDLVYPVGSIYMSVNSISPETLFGGSWERIEDKFLLSSGSTYRAGNTGGASTVTLSKAQMPTHTHTINNAHHTHKGGDNQYFVNFKTSALAFSEKKSPSSGAYRYLFTARDDQDMYMHTTTGYESNTISNANEGSSQAHENMPPYLVVNIWKRTA